MELVKFANNLRIVRNSNGVSAAELAKKCKLRHIKRILDIEEGRGKPTLEEVCAICDVLGVSIDNMINKSIKVEYLWE